MFLSVLVLLDSVGTRQAAHPLARLFYQSSASPSEDQAVIFKVRARCFGSRLGDCLWLVLVPAIITRPACFGLATGVIHLRGDSEGLNWQSKCDSAPPCLTQPGQRCHGEKGQQLVCAEQKMNAIYTFKWLAEEQPTRDPCKSPKIKVLIQRGSLLLRLAARRYCATHWATNCADVWIFAFQHYLSGITIPPWHFPSDTSGLNITICKTKLHK